MAISACDDLPPSPGASVYASDSVTLTTHTPRLAIAIIDRVPGPKELRGAAAVATSLAYVVGLAGVVAGGLILGEDNLAVATVIWVLTFAAGAALMIAAMVVRAIASLLARQAMLEQDVRTLVGDRARDRERPEEGESWGHQPPW
ncbi:MAG: hypothetical protein ACI867_001360 [Glaciecola sp.]